VRRAVAEDNPLRQVDNIVQLTEQPIKDDAGKDNRPVYGPQAPPTNDELEARAREEETALLIKKIFSGVADELRDITTDDPAYKRLMAILEADQQIDNTGPFSSSSRSPAERQAIELGYFYNVLTDAIKALKRQIDAHPEDARQLNQIQDQLYALRSALRTAYDVLGLKDVVVRGHAFGADAPTKVSGTGIDKAAEVARDLLAKANNGIEATGDETIIIDVVSFFGKGILKGLGRGALSLLARLAATHADDIVRPVVPAITRALAPTVTRIMQNLVDDAVADIVRNPNILRRFLSRRALEAVEDNPQLAEAAFGRAVERIVARRIRGDATLSQLFLQAEQRAANGRFRSIYDFAGIGRGQGLLFDITTRRDLAGHTGRWYSDLVEFIVYDYPQGFRFPAP
ncbi:MAG TPA: hypothetical protein VFI31_08890, partial [Pirellulales bacterium]|nr:hypothetical protein [Pirellulales bacterium]